MPSGAQPPVSPPPLPPSQQRPPEPPPQPLKITRTKTPTGSILLGKYQLGRLLGRGSFAKVHEAASLEDDNTVVAVKIIDKTKTVDAAMEPRIIREVSAMRRLQHHPNILKIHEVMATKTKIYLVMELATGLNFSPRSYAAAACPNPPPVATSPNWSPPSISATKTASPTFQTLASCGTPAYTAPEVVRRKGYDGPKADAWSYSSPGVSVSAMDIKASKRYNMAAFRPESIDPNELNKANGNSMVQENNFNESHIRQPAGKFVTGQEVKT
ncbi:hypothetical protein GQ457_13G025650 [Hibiscus cannabinus]